MLFFPNFGSWKFLLGVSSIFYGDFIETGTFQKYCTICFFLVTDSIKSIFHSNVVEMFLGVVHQVFFNMFLTKINLNKTPH